jgi:acyl-coenzyme A thioesterase PaaI-like protein
LAWVSAQDRGIAPIAAKLPLRDQPVNRVPRSSADDRQTARCRMRLSRGDARGGGCRGDARDGGCRGDARGDGLIGRTYRATLRGMSKLVDPEAGWHDTPKTCAFADLIGPVQRRRDGDHWVYGLRVTQLHTNSIGTMHGGLVTAFLDEVTGEIVNALGNRKHVTLQFITTFLSTAQVGDFLECACEIVCTTRSMTFVQARLNVAGAPIATATAIFKAAPPRPAG